MFNRCFMLLYVFLITHEYELIPITVFTNIFDRIIGKFCYQTNSRPQIRKSDLVFFSYTLYMLIILEY